MPMNAGLQQAQFKKIGKPNAERLRSLASRNDQCGCFLLSLLVIFCDTDGHFNSCCQWYRDTPLSEVLPRQCNCQGRYFYRSSSLCQNAWSSLQGGRRCSPAQRVHYVKAAQMRARGSLPGNGYPAAWLNLQSGKISMLLEVLLFKWRSLIVWRIRAIQTYQRSSCCWCTCTCVTHWALDFSHPSSHFLGLAAGRGAKPEQEGRAYGGELNAPSSSKLYSCS